MLTDAEFMRQPFDFDAHNGRFVNYCEVVVLPDGEIRYAVPSHQGFLEGLCREMGVDPVEDCPRDMLCDYLAWMMQVTGAVLVWHGFYQAVTITPRQRKALQRLQLEGCCRFERRI